MKHKHDWVHCSLKISRYLRRPLTRGILRAFQSKPPTVFKWNLQLMEHTRQLWPAQRNKRLIHKTNLEASRSLRTFWSQMRDYRKLNRIRVDSWGKMGNNIWICRKWVQVRGKNQEANTWMVIIQKTPKIWAQYRDQLPLIIWKIMPFPSPLKLQQNSSKTTKNWLQWSKMENGIWQEARSKGT